jgi:hypothetical protein
MQIIFEAKRTHYIETKLFRSEANTLDRNIIIYKAKQTRLSESKLFSKRSEHIR